MHPTTTDDRILAQELINVMHQHANEKLHLGNGSMERTGPVTVGFWHLIARETLISDPSQSVASNVPPIGWIGQALDGTIGRILH